MLSLPGTGSASLSKRFRATQIKKEIDLTEETYDALGQAVACVCIRIFLQLLSRTAERAIGLQYPTRPMYLCDSLYPSNVDLMMLWIKGHCRWRLMMARWLAYA